MPEAQNLEPPEIFQKRETPETAILTVGGTHGDCMAERVTASVFLEKGKSW